MYSSLSLSSPFSLSSHTAGGGVASADRLLLRGQDSCRLTLCRDSGSKRDGGGLESSTRENSDRAQGTTRSSPKYVFVASHKVTFVRELCMLPSPDDHQQQREKQVTIIRDLEKKVADLEQQLESLSSQESEGSGEMPAEDSHIYDHPPEVSPMSCMLFCTWSCLVLSTIFSIRL